MFIRPPKALAPRDPLKQDPLSAALEHEVLAEKAATYGRLVQKLEKALAKLREDWSEETLNAAGQALWYVMVQRDLCGFRRHDRAEAADLAQAAREAYQACGMRGHVGLADRLLQECE